VSTNLKDRQLLPKALSFAPWRSVVDRLVGGLSRRVCNARRRGAWPRPDISRCRAVPGGRWLAETEDTGPHLVVGYTPLSARPDLDRQVARVAEWSATGKLPIDRYVREIGSGLNDARKKLAAC
jgi:hypothetical protein